MRDRVKRLWEIFIVFLRIGAFTFGGGYAMIPLIRRETAENRKWISAEEIAEIVAIAESTPGPIAINAATFTGYRVGGFAGAFIATVGMVLPSFVVIAALSGLLHTFYDLRAVQYALRGVRAGVLALILHALWMMWRQTPKKLLSCLVMAGAFAAVAFLKVNVLYVILACALTGFVWTCISERGRRT